MTLGPRPSGYYHEPKDPNYAPKHAKTEVSDLDTAIYRLEERLELGLANPNAFDEDEQLMLQTLTQLKRLRIILEQAAIEEWDAHQIEQTKRLPLNTTLDRRQVEALLRTFERNQARNPRTLDRPTPGEPTDRPYKFSDAGVTYEPDALQARIERLKRGNPRDIRFD